VGKTSFVNRVLSEVIKRSVDRSTDNLEERVVDVYLTFARALEPLGLLYHVLRSLYLRLDALALLPFLDARLLSDLKTAFHRTSQTITFSSHLERQIGADFKSPAGTKLLGELSLLGRRSTESSRSESYLPYDDKAAEYDLISIARRLACMAPASRPGWRYWFRSRFDHSSARRLKLKIVFVFDELDKLDEPAGATSVSGALDTVLTTFKTLFTTSGLTFVFVGGKDLHDRWVDDLGRGDSVFESIFTYCHYLPTLWAEARPLCDALIGRLPNHSAHYTNSDDYVAFTRYLSFRGRGIPRKIIRGFNEQVKQVDGGPSLVFTLEDIRRSHFYANLQRTLNMNSDRIFPRQDECGAEDIDKLRLGVYYLVDWMLLRGSDPFSAEDVIATSQRLSRLIAPVEPAAPAIVAALLDVLVANEFLEVVTDNHSHLLGIPPTTVARVLYRVPRRRLYEMGRLRGAFDQEALAFFEKVRTDGHVNAAPAAASADDEKTMLVADTRTLSAHADQVLFGRYRIVKALGEGGMSTVLLAVDEFGGQLVAVKRLRPELWNHPEVRERARREAALLQRLDHPNIVKVYDINTEADGVAMIMEYLDGPTLADLINQEKLIRHDAALNLTIMRELCRAVACLHDHGIVWRDPKPSNVIITTTGRVVLFDLNIARSGRSTVTQVAIGTPSYMSPEQARGEVVDAQSDIFGLGAILYEIVTGRRAFAGDTFEVLEAIRSRDVSMPSDLATIDQPVSVVIRRCLAKNKAERFQTVRDMIDALPAGKDASAAGALAELVREATCEAQAAGAETLVAARRRGSAGPRPAPPDAPGVDVDSWLASGGRILCALGVADMSVGRGVDNDVRVSNVAASRYHAKIVFKENAHWIEDLNSGNGTFVNDNRVRMPMRVADGDVITIGTDELIYSTRLKVKRRLLTMPRVELADQPAVPAASSA
jgi:tRNA A-37 threonylcarbamoyl transferase component Bud32